MKKQFTEFLKKHKAYSDYCENIKTCSQDEDFHNITEFLSEYRKEPDTFILNAFVWDKTPQKHNYWSNLNYSWKEICENQKK